jgi:hypothetical protein
MINTTPVPDFAQIDLFFDFGTLSLQAPAYVAQIPETYESWRYEDGYGKKLCVMPPPTEFAVYAEISDYHSPFWEILLAFSRGGLGYKVPFLLSQSKSGTTIEGVVYTPHDLEAPRLQTIVLTEKGFQVEYAPQTIEFKTLGTMTARWPAPSQTTLSM